MGDIQRFHVGARLSETAVHNGTVHLAGQVADAERIGLDYKGGTPVRIGTANGVVQGWQVRLDAVRVGDVEVAGVEAVVSPQSMPYVLLGNSFIGRFSMRRDSDQMVLEKRY